MFSTLLEVACRAAREASAAILAAMDKPHRIDFKSWSNLVTDTDRKSEAIIINTLQSEFPDHGILAEESERKKTDSEYLWVIDPLDGTTNFVHGYPPFSVSIGCFKNQQPVLGVIVELPANQLYSAVDQKGSYWESQRIQVSSVSTLDRSLLLTGFGYEHGSLWEANMDLFKTLTNKTQGVRRLGSAAVDLCHVARGIIDGFWEFDLHPWDSAAGIVILQEAGGTVTRMDGEPFNIFDRQILATNGIIHKELLTFTKTKVLELHSSGITV
ncbi:MAG: inositol monophosphatase family protein [Fidelibacterota bacterium]